MTPKSIARSLVRMAKRPFRRRPRIVMTLLCRDEEDIVGYNIAYHLSQGVDFVIATDNASRDRTPELLERFARQGKLHLIREPSLTHDQGPWVTRMARMAAKRFDADWVINNDADEFWLSREGSLRDALTAVPPQAESLAVPHFDMLPPRAAQMPFFEAMTIRRADGKTVYGRPLQTNVCHRAFADIRVADGNHFVSRKGVRIPERTDHPLEFAHFPIRSLAQLERKIRQGSEALSANERIKPSTGGHWQKLYRDHHGKGSLGEYYDACAPTPEQIDAGLADGTLARETRVRDALHRIDLRAAAPY
jgi:hypothetical protein